MKLVFQGLTAAALLTATGMTEADDRVAGRRPEQLAVRGDIVAAGCRSAWRCQTVSHARIHPHRAERAGPHPVRALDLLAERSRATSSGR